MSGRLRVVVVDDSLTVRRHLVELLSQDAGIEVVGEASEARQAIELIERLRPDVVSLDLVLGERSGLEVTEHVMAYCPTPILVVSSAENRGEAHRTLDALAAGAVDVLDKSGEAHEAGWDARFVAALKRVSRIRVITHPRARLGRERGRPAPPPPSSRAREVRALAIGASTGGPAALARVFSALPADFPVPILLVLHIGAAFAGPFAAWLDGLSRVRVRLAADGEPLPPPGQGAILMAPADRHLVLQGERLHLSDAPERHSCRPSVDVLFESVATSLGASAAGCLLTGMGRDGAAGLLAIRRAGGATLAQDEASSIVYGMPREAALLGAAEQVLPLDQIAPALEALVR